MRQAFSLWKRTKGDGATSKALVCALGDQQWNDEADKIAKQFNIPRVKGRLTVLSIQAQFTNLDCSVLQVETDDADMGLNIGLCIFFFQQNLKQNLIDIPVFLLLKVLGSVKKWSQAVCQFLSEAASKLKRLTLLVGAIFCLSLVLNTNALSNSCQKYLAHPFIGTKVL